LRFAEKLVQRDYAPQQHNCAENSPSGNLHGFLPKGSGENTIVTENGRLAEVTEAAERMGSHSAALARKQNL
jgi:hypothetical protein